MEKKFNKALKEYVDLMNAIFSLPPRGEGARAEVVKELKQKYDKLIKELRELNKYVTICVEEDLL